MILSLFRKDPNREAAEALYAAAADQSRLPQFYRLFEVEDNVEGRFEMAALHVYLLLRRLKQAGDGGERLSRRLTEVFFSELDAALRELGVGDLSVGKKIRKLAEAFYGRIAAYETALHADDDPEALSRALARNVYGREQSASAGLLADYLRRSIAALASQPDARIALGIATFATPQKPSRDDC